MAGKRTLVRVGEVDLGGPLELDVLVASRIKYLSKNGPYRVYVNTGHKQRCLQVSFVHETACFSQRTRCIHGLENLRASVVTRASDTFSARDSWHSANETGMTWEDGRTRHSRDQDHQTGIR